MYLKKRISWILVVVLVFSVGSAHAQYSSTAYGGKSDESFLTRTSDWFATLGMSQEEKYIALKERRAARKIKKAQKAIEQRQKEIARKRKANKK